MWSIIFLIGLCIGYYYLHQKYPREDKEVMYAGIFVVSYLVVLYLLHYERDFLYKIFKNMYETHKQPLYSFDALGSNSDLFQVRSPTHQAPFKTQVLQNQGSRCSQCKSFILMKDTDKYHLDYKRSLYHGGENSLQNLEVVCQSCYDFKRN